MTEQFKGIQVQGTGKIALAPNVAYINGGVITQAPKVAKAVRDNTEKMTKVLVALKKVGVPERSIITTALRINPVWSSATKTKKRIITGYTAQNGVTVKLKNMELVGEVIDALSATTNDVDLNFAAEYPEKEAEALGLALQDAKNRATKIAEASGVKLGQLYSCIESMHHNLMPRTRGAHAMAAPDPSGGGMPVVQGDIDVTSTVTAVYTIEPA